MQMEIEKVTVEEEETRALVMMKLREAGEEDEMKKQTQSMLNLIWETEVSHRHPRVRSSHRNSGRAERLQTLPWVIHQVLA